MTNKIKPIAIHLPQFHPFPENDEWWGKGFTEWTNVTKAKPLFKEHYQPHLPADLGFYDLRLEEARLAQIALAKEYGIYGFCYYHYWFNGKRLMQEPIDRMLKNPKEDFPFMFCWANENWSRRWDGSEDILLIKQEYSIDDAINHCKHLISYFSDRRYIRIHDKPVFAIYKPYLIPNLAEYVSSFREEARKSGIELYLCNFETGESLDYLSSNTLFDAAVEFQPQSQELFTYMNIECVRRLQHSYVQRLFNKTLRAFKMHQSLEDQIHKIKHWLDYESYVTYLIANRKRPVYKKFPGITPMWDNTARKGKNSFILKNSTPSKYAKWLEFILSEFKPFSDDENLLFINAWNEWAEGNHLEPCRKWGLQYLDATRDTINKNRV